MSGWLHPCRQPGCPQLLPTSGFCDKHRRDHARLQDRRRPSSTRRGYDRTWAALRAQVLREQPWCACGARATEVHHLVTIRSAPALRLNKQYLKQMCRRCHSATTMRESVRRSP